MQSIGPKALEASFSNQHLYIVGHFEWKRCKNKTFAKFREPKNAKYFYGPKNILDQIQIPRKHR